MTIVEATISVANTIYQLIHNCDDCRWLVDPLKTDELGNPSPILIFDRSLGVRDENGKIGDLSHMDGRWYFMRNPLRSMIDTGVAGEIGYSTILRAELFVCQKHLERMARERATFTHAFDTEGGLID